MYAGHFAAVFLLYSYDSTVNSFLLTFGVVFIDIIMGILAYFSVEGFKCNPNGDGHGIELHIPISHSLLSSLCFSCLWGCLNSKHFGILFVSSFSHFVLDWFVHNLDLELYPFSNFFVGGIGLSSKYPRVAYYFELLLCIFSCILFIQTNSYKSLSLVLSIIYLFYLQCYRALFIGSELYSLTQITPKQKQGRLTCQCTMKAFVIPAIVLGTLLELIPFV
ncbi:unnamed protein product [Adineta steineri]|uniref:Uncharacterized protein n=1 Tax=Adineta steineri TaxID=433720 RepID=A0A815NWB1_9BILA|nr:unnamed protein product [Adineta steineri]CAF3912309.1 unnamed protein product [Adineta steineri]